MTNDRLSLQYWDWSRTVALAVLTGVSLYVCYLLAAPFLPAITWAVALAIIGLPFHLRVRRVVTHESWAAGLSTVAVVLAIAVPVALVATQLAVEAKAATETVRALAADGRLRDAAARVPFAGEWLAGLDAVQVEAHARSAAAQFVGRSGSLIGSVGEGVLQALAAVFILFFCLRDHHHLLESIHRLIPLVRPDADRVIARAGEAVHATVYGTLLAGTIQGVSGGLLFWALGLPAPVVWGVVMTVLAVLPLVGAFLVWAPAAAFLASDGRWGAGAALVAWGLLMAGPVGSYIYAVAAGNRMKLHPVPALLAFVGGLAVFGVSGMVVGPCVLAVTVALLDIWRHRASGTPAAPLSPPSSDRSRDSSQEVHDKPRNHGPLV